MFPSQMYKALVKSVKGLKISTFPMELNSRSSPRNYPVRPGLFVNGCYGFDIGNLNG